jgi:EmrB/QacA subfamily drug resistance transporter
VRRERLLPLIVASALFIENMESTAISTSLPEIAADLGVEAVVLKLALTAYMLALAVFIPISGWVSDRFGSQRTFMAAIAVFMCGSIACAASHTLGGLITARFMQGIGGAMMVPVGRLVLLRSIEKSQLVRALSWLTVPALLGPMLGPVVGGFITTYSHWRYIFLVNLPIGALGIWFAWRHIPQLYGPVGRLDWVGFFLSSMGLAATMFGLSMLGRQMAGTALLLGVSVVGVSLLVMYVLHAKRHPHPLINLELFRVPTYRIGVLGGALFRIGVGATPLLLPLMLQLGFGYDPLESGLITFAGAAGAMFMKTIAAWILKRFGFRRVLVFNAVVASLFLVPLGLFRADTPYVMMVGVLLIGGCFRSLQFTSLNAIIYADIDQARMSQASSLAAMVQQIALATGVTIGGYALSLASIATGQPVGDSINFTLAFATIALISLGSVFSLRRLAPDAGAEMSGRAQPGQEIAEPKPTARPGT